MGLFDGMRINQMGNRAYAAHADANDLQRRGPVADAAAKYEAAMKLYRRGS